jgi:uncharacterized circularly permuted ATP-grasp superfamily protein/uncharacterized alpha-E superfamily protein
MTNAAPPRAAEAMPGRDEFLQAYQVTPGVHDELIGRDGNVRPHWQPFVDQFLGMAAPDRAAATDMAQRLLRENGVTHMVADDADGDSRPWTLDLFPLLVDPDDWATLEAGLIQRATVLNAALQDLYGPQRLLREGVLPPALVFGNPQFLRPAHNLKISGGVYMHFVAFDVARGPDGKWWVLSDRTQAPSGAGYALENRIIATRCLPDYFAEGRVRRLASFFHAFAEHFLAMSRRDEPLAVLLTPGPARDIYFEHAYLARYLGYSVVEGYDLTVRDDRLFLKTIEGLKLVDLVLRRIDGDMCDPLELRTDSYLGVPGLVQVVRDGNVTLANALGAGVVENEALLSFMPALSRFFLNEELKLPSIATWWAGQPREQDYLVQHLRELVVRKVSPKTMFTPGRDSFVGPDLTDEQAESLAAAIRRHGRDYIGQEMVSVSSMPVWSPDTGLQPAPMTLRVYLAATENGYRMMPGGLARVSRNGGSRVPWLTPGDITKDVWVLSDGPADNFSLLNDPQHHRLRRSGRDLPSRAADNLFWLGRYAERAEGAVRMLRSLVLYLSGEATSLRDAATLDRLVSLLVVQQHLSARKAKRALGEGMRAVEAELWSILFDPDSPDGLSSVLGNVSRIADLVRERLSSDTWNILKSMSEEARSWKPQPGQEVADASRLLGRLIQLLAALNGMIMENMTRGYGWRFLDLGRRIERVRYISRVVRDTTARAEGSHTSILELLLELADSTMTYRGRYKAGARLPQVLDLLLADPSNPRSLMFQLDAVDAHVQVLPQEDASVALSPAQRIITGLIAEVKLADLVQLAEASARSGARLGLDRLLRRVEAGADELSNIITRTYFSHSMAQHVSGPHRLETNP